MTYEGAIVSFRYSQSRCVEETVVERWYYTDLEPTCQKPTIQFACSLSACCNNKHDQTWFLLITNEGCYVRFYLFIFIFLRSSCLWEKVKNIRPYKNTKHLFFFYNRRPVFTPCPSCEPCHAVWTQPIQVTSGLSFQDTTALSRSSLPNTDTHTRVETSCGVRN